MLSQTWLMKAATGSLLRVGKQLDHVIRTRLPQWCHDTAGDADCASNQGARAVNPPGAPTQDRQQEPDQTRLMKAAAESQERLRDRLEHIIRTRLPNWCHDAIGRNGDSRPSASESSLDQKRQEAKEIIDRYAGLAAANAFNPIPVLDVGIDMRLMIAMSEALAAAYGLGQDQTQALAGTKISHSPALRHVAERTTPYLAERVAAGFLPRLGLELVARESSKWIPFIGSLIAARIGYRMACRFGEKVLQECEATVCS